MWRMRACASAARRAIHCRRDARAFGPRLAAPSGAQLDVGPRWGIRLDYDNYGTVGEEFETGRADIETVSVNFVYRF